MTHERKAQLIAAIGARFARLLFATLRFRVIDRAGVLATPPQKPLLWAFWHNRLCVSAYMFERFFPDRPGGAGQQEQGRRLIAAFIQRLGFSRSAGRVHAGGARRRDEARRRRLIVGLLTPAGRAIT